MKIIKKISFITLTYILVISFTGCSFLGKSSSAKIASISSRISSSVSDIMSSSSSLSSSISSIASSLAPSLSSASSSKASSSKPKKAASSKTSDAKPVSPVIPVVKVDTTVPVQPVASPSSAAQAANGLPSTFQDFWGNTGISGIQVYEYGKGLLNSSERNIYDQLLSNIQQVNNNFTINTTCNPSSINKIFEYLYNDHSEIFYIHGNTGYSYSSSNNNYIYTFNLGYDYGGDKNTILTMRNQMGSAAVALLNQAMSKLGSNATDYDKEKAIHDTVVKQFSYDMAAAEKPAAPFTSFTAYGAFVNNTCVCDGYARAMNILLGSANIKSLYVSGTAATSTSSGAHAWNMVDLSGIGWFYVDATFDDPIIQNSDGTYSGSSTISWAYFDYPRPANSSNNDPGCPDRGDHLLSKFLADNWSESQNYQYMPKAGTVDSYYSNT
jgi:hypothetical protein